MYIRASEPIGYMYIHFSYFHILKLLFISIYCWYFRYFVGINYMLVGLHVKKEKEKSIMGRGRGQ